MGAATRKKLETDGHKVIGIDLRDAEVVADLSTDDGRSSAVSETMQRCNGTLDGLVTAAGLGPPVRGELIAKVNYFGAVALLEGLRPALAATSSAQVVQIGSNSSTTSPNLPVELVEAYLSGDESEAVRLVNLTPEPFGEGITLNVIAPGPVQTPLFQMGKDDDDYGPLLEGFPVPAGDPATAEMLADWIVFLLSPSARFACGSVIFVDGGTDALLRADAWPETFTLDL